MKKSILSIVIAVMMVVACAVSISAGRCDGAFASADFTLIQEYGVDAIGTHQMRAFCVDPNGKYYFGGNLQSGTMGAPTLYKFDPNSGNVLATYQFAVDPGAYVKALVADDRGYVYNGIANAANDGAFFFSILNMDSMEEQSYMEVKIDGKIGVNGIGVANVGGTYYCYVMSNYDTDRLYRFDVTDVKAPKLDTSFGTNGYIDMAATYNYDDCNGVATDVNGFIYVSGLKSGGEGKGDTISKLNFDGSLVEEMSVANVWNVSMFDDEYIVASTRGGADSKVYVIDSDLMEVIAEFAPVADAAGFSGAGIMNNKIYVCDHSEFDKVFVSNTLAITEKVVEPETTAEEVVDAAAADTTADAAVETAPKTFDAAIIAAVAAIVSAAGYAVSKKH